MSYLPGYKFDILLLYAAADSLDGWVEEFRNALAKEIEVMLGSQISIFDATKSFPPGSSSDELDRAIEAGAALLPVLSPSFINTASCLRSVKQFVASRSRDIDAGLPIFPVLVRQLELGSLPQPLNLAQVAFFVREDGRPMDARSPEWRSQIARLATAFKNLLEGLRRKMPVSAELGDSPRPAFSKAAAANSSPSVESFAVGESLAEFAGAPSSKLPPNVESLEKSASPISYPPPKSSPNIPYFRPDAFQFPDPPTSRSDDKSGDRAPNRPDSTTSISEPERVTAHKDNPAYVDELGRRSFAEVLAARIKECWTKDDHPANGEQNFGDASNGGFMVHIDGPWGSGKTSVLNFLREELQNRGKATDQPCVVVNFNAWRQQRIRPPWWTLIREIYGQSQRQLSYGRKLSLALRWWRWRLRADWLPILLTVVAISVWVSVTMGMFKVVPKNPSVQPAGSAFTDQNVDTIFKILTGILAAGATLFTLNRTMIFGSARAAQAYTDLRSDPLRPIVNLFGNLIRTLGKPLIVMIDDLDRCDGKYVVELLEGIQTLFRRESVTYVIAADRKWIRSSFEQEFRDYNTAIGEPGRPLGYLFLDKVFQVSVSIPRLSAELQGTYWKGLLSGPMPNSQTLEERKKEAEELANRAVDGIHTQEGLQNKIENAGDDPVRKQAAREAAARQITGREAQAQTEHRLQRWAQLLEHNPRSMKRLLNAVAMQQAIHFLEGRQVSLETLAQWTIIELRWPILADFLASVPESIECFQDATKLSAYLISEDLKQLFNNKAVKAIIEAKEVKGASALDEAQISKLVG